MSTKLITFKHSVSGVLTNATSVKLSDPTAAYGLRRVSDGSVVVADAADFTHDSTGVYSYAASGLTAGVEYEYWIEWVYGGATKRVDRLFTAGADTSAIPGYPISTLRNAAELAAGGPGSIRGGGSLDLIITQAIERLVSFRPWNWQVTQTTLSLTASTAYVTLPADFGQLVAIDGNSTNRYHFRPVTVAEVLRMRAERPTTVNVSSGYQWGYAIDSAAQSAANVPSRWRLELYPTPPNSETDAITLAYRRRITLPSLSDGEGAVVDVPPQVSACLLSLVRAEAALVALNGDKPTAARYGAYEQAAQQQLANLVDRDGTMTPTGGRLRGTVLELADWQNAHKGRFYTDTPVTIS